MNTIELEHIAKVYRVPSLLPWNASRRVEALRDITFRAPAEKITCLLGPNGAGKTTIVKILAGLIEPDRGEGRILDRPLAVLERRMRGRIGFLTANDRSFYWRLTGRQNLDFFASLQGLKGGDRTQRVHEVLGEVELGEAAEKPFRLYSSGMKQKLLMARALLGRPELLLLDEPTAHLDYTARTSIHRFIRDRLIRARKCSVLLCTNDLSEAEKLADHLVLIDEGRVLAEGPLASLRSRVKSSGNLVLSFEKVPARGWDRKLGIRLLRREAATMVFAVPPEVRTADVVEAAVRNGGRLVGCRSDELSLPEVFERMTRPDA
jgi:ABC-2 type transport system ATP-binding protein